MKRAGWTLLTVTAWLVLAGDARAQDGSAKAIFEKFGLLGTFAWDCGQPPTRENQYFVNRLVDQHVQRDQMIGPSTRGFVVIIDRATELKPNEILVAGLWDGQPVEATWRIEKSKMVQLEVSISGQKEIVGGRLVRTGREMPWLNKCQ